MQQDKSAGSHLRILPSIADFIRMLIATCHCNRSVFLNKQPVLISLDFASAFAIVKAAAETVINGRRPMLIWRVLGVY